MVCPRRLSVLLGIRPDGHCPLGLNRQPRRKRSPLCESWVSAIDPIHYAYRGNDHRSYLAWLTGLSVIVHLERARNEFRLVTATVGVPCKGCLRHSDCSWMLVDIRIGASSINRIVFRSNRPERHRTAKSCKA